MTAWSLQTASTHFKDKYGPISENVYNSANVLLARVKKRYDFTGKRKILDVPTGFGGGVGSGRKPTPNADPSVNPIISSAKMYATCKIDRESIKAADGADGSWVKQTKHTVGKCVESWMRNMSRALWNSFDNGELGRGDGSTTVTGAGTEGDPYLVKINASYWKEANWEEKDYVNVGTEESLLEVYSVNTSTRVISLVGTSATLAAAVAGATFTSAKFYMQNSKDNDPISIWSVLSATSGTLYSVDVKRRWQSPVQKDSNDAGITTDLLTSDVLDLEKACGKPPTMIVMGYAQYKKLLNQISDKQYYEMAARAENLKATVSFKGLALATPMGPIPMFYDRFCEDDRVAYLNDSFIELHHRPDFGWFDDDGTVFLRSRDDDAYEADYGGYLQNYMIPAMHGYRYNLAV